MSTVSGQVIRLNEGSQLVFGRGPEVDLAISAGRGLSRRAGVIAATPDGAWIANISQTHALYVAGDGYRIRLPRVEGDGDPAGGWLVHAGTAMVGSRSMLDDGLQIAVTVPGRHRRSRGADTPVAGQEAAQPDGDGTVLPLYLDPKTKLFLVALMWCRPWLLDPSAASPLPRTPEIARAALEVTGAHHELERFDTDSEFRDRLSARVAEHLKVLRRKISERGLTGPDVRLSDEVAVRVLIEHGVVAPGDLRLLADPAWCSRQEDLWWTRDLAVRARV
ncbi:MAG TPA: FHA domain-containing protein [Trebonia sp.]